MRRLILFIFFASLITLIIIALICVVRKEYYTQNNTDCSGWKPCGASCGCPAAPCGNCPQSTSNVLTKARAFVDKYIIKQKSLFKTDTSKTGKLLYCVFKRCLADTINNTVYYDEVKHPTRTFVVTGDIHAMWIRDSCNQVMPYMEIFDKSPELKTIIKGVIQEQALCLGVNIFANSFCDTNFTSDDCKQNSGLYTKYNASSENTKNGIFEHESKWELDSLGAFLRLSRKFYQKTKDASIFTKEWNTAFKSILVVLDEQSKELMPTYKLYYGTSAQGWWVNKEPPCVDPNNMQPKTSPACPHWGYPNHYYFANSSASGTTSELLFDSIGYPAKNPNYPNNPKKIYKLVRSAFTPSDASLRLNFSIPANTMVATELSLIKSYLDDNKICTIKLQNTVTGMINAIEDLAVVQIPGNSNKVIAYAIDGYGSQIIQDDANIPSLLSLKYLDAFTPKPDKSTIFSPEFKQSYDDTRPLLLDPDKNPFYFRGKPITKTLDGTYLPKGGITIEGEGSLHTGLGLVWPMGIIMQALTSNKSDEIVQCVQRLLVLANATNIEISTNVMHESAGIDYDTIKYTTRCWFAWANGLFGELVMKMINEKSGVFAKAFEDLISES